MCLYDLCQQLPLICIRQSAEELYVAVFKRAVFHLELLHGGDAQAACRLCFNEIALFIIVIEEELYSVSGFEFLCAFLCEGQLIIDKIIS